MKSNPIYNGCLILPLLFFIGYGIYNLQIYLYNLNYGVTNFLWFLINVGIIYVVYRLFFYKGKGQ